MPPQRIFSVPGNPIDPRCEHRAPSARSLTRCRPGRSPSRSNSPCAKRRGGIAFRQALEQRLKARAGGGWRSGLSREYIRLLSTNQRGPGGFPAPVTYADHKTRLWHWPDVAHWLIEHKRAKVVLDAHAADLVAAMNAAFDLREHARHLHNKHDLALVAQALGEDTLHR